MDLCVTTTNEQIRKIEDIIDIQKAHGSFTVRQVAFNLPADAPMSANQARSLESGLSESKSSCLDKKKVKKSPLKRHKSPMPDAFSWPSDSDITVLRMKLCLNSSDLKDKVDSLVPGDGLHQPDSSSMVNLATLMRQSQPPSKHCLTEEYLLPLSSWEHDQQDTKIVISDVNYPEDRITQHNQDGFDTGCSRADNNGHLYQGDGELLSETSTKSKIARFLRLYFCPCCRCLYKMENMSDDHSTYWEKRKGLIFQ